MSRGWLALGGLALLLCAGLAWWSATLPPAIASAGPTPPSAVAPATLGSGDSAADVFGVNEAVTIPEVFLRRGQVAPAAEAAMLARSAQAAKKLGVRVVRANSPVYPFLSQHALEQSGWDWTRADAWFKAVGDAGLDVVVVLGPWPGTRTGAYTDRYLPADLAAYKAYVKRVVERYDGDGVSDMPGLARPVLAWEADNEPDLHNTVPPKGATGATSPADFETPSEYASVLIATAAAVREAAPGALVLSGGIYYGGKSTGTDYLNRVFAVPGARAAPDIISVHCYFSDDSLDPLEACLKNGRALAGGKPFWITETSVPSDNRSAWTNQAWQARMVAAIYGAALAGGAGRVFWHTLADPPLGTFPSGQQGAKAAPFASNSLLQTQPGAEGGKGPSPGGDKVPKPAGEVYRRLAGHLAGVPRASVTEVKSAGGRLLATPSGWLAFWGSPALPAGAGAVEDLVTGQTSRPTGGSVKAPAWISR